MSSEKVLEPPENCGVRGQRLWAAVTAEFQLDPRELGVLAEACKTADELARLEVTVAGAELLVEGSMGQPVANRLLGEVRAHRRLLALLLAELHLPEAAAVRPGLRAVRGRGRGREQQPQEPGRELGLAELPPHLQPRVPEPRHVSVARLGWLEERGWGPIDYVRALLPGGPR